MDAYQLHSEMHHIMHRFKCLPFCELTSKVSRGEFFMLRHSLDKMREEKRESLYVSEVVQLMDVTAPAISRMLKSLEDKGFIIRELDKENRRNTIVRLTKEAATYIDEAEARMGKVMEGVIVHMGEENITQFVELCNRMADALNEELMCAIKSEKTSRE